MRLTLLASVFCLGLLPLSFVSGQETLPAWNDTPTKRAIIGFVDRVTDPRSPDFVPAPERIAVFDNDGTLWSEQPVYVQLAFILDRLRTLAPQHPEWRQTQPFQAALEGDFAGLSASGEAGLMQLVMATHAGLTTEEFRQVVEAWLATAEHPTLKRPYTECVYQPMLELLAYLRAAGFKTYIVSGGGVEFMRPWTEKVYGIPPEQVVGSSIKMQYELRDGQPALVRLPAMNFIDDKGGKPVGIQQQIGRRPILAFGNSDGDFEMLEYATLGAGPSLGLLLHHTDATREFAYDRQSHFGRLDRGLDEAPARGWVVVDMQQDWRQVFPNLPQ